MTENDRIADQILDLVVYAPIGLALEAKELLPKLADRGRGQVALTRLMGKVASDRGQTEVRKVVDQVVDQVVGAVSTVLATDDHPSAEADVDATTESAGGPEAPPIEGYDTLSAPDLLPHLAALSPDGLAAVLAYEQAHRSRATVINRVRQLQA